MNETRRERIASRRGQLSEWIGKAVRVLRKQRGLTQVQLAERLGVTRTAIVQWETQVNDPQLDRLPAVAAVFGLRTSELIAFAENRFDPKRVAELEAAP